MQCILLSTDLMFGTQAAAAAREAGYDVCSVAGVEDLVALPAETLRGVRVVLADLTMPQFNAQDAADRVHAAVNPPPHLLAVGPHVHRAKLDAARQAGWRIYTRGQFHASAGSILRELSSLA